MLVVGTEPPQTMKVDSRVLCRSSSVFNRMLKGPFLESKSCSHNAWEVKLPEDDPQALLIIMDIVHNQYEHAPAEPALDVLCHVLSLVDKYVMGKSLRSISYLWLDQERDKDDQPLKDREACLFVAFELGAVDLFGQIATRLAIECKVDDSGKLLAADGQSRLIDNEFVNRINIVGK